MKVNAEGIFNIYAILLVFFLEKKLILEKHISSHDKPLHNKSPPTMCWGLINSVLSIVVAIIQNSMTQMLYTNIHPIFTIFLLRSSTVG